jgi:hypothetical protein
MKTMQMVLSVVAFLFCAQSGFAAIECPKADYESPAAESQHGNLKRLPGQDEAVSFGRGRAITNGGFNRNT